MLTRKYQRACPKIASLLDVLETHGVHACCPSRCLDCMQACALGVECFVSKICVAWLDIDLDACIDA